MSTWLRLTLITLTVGGGFTGIALTSQLLLSPQVTGPTLLAICLAFLLLHLFVLVAGLLFVHNPARTTPLLAALAIQIPYLSSPLLTYRFADGLFAGAGLAQSGPFAWLRFGADWQFSFLQPVPWALGINLAAVAALAALALSLSRQRRQPSPPLPANPPVAQPPEALDQVSG